MSILTGAMQARFFAVENPGEAANPMRMEEALQNNAFPFGWQGAGTRVGWVSVDNMLEASFSGTRDWLVGHLAVFALRMDVRTVPSRLLKARVQQECEKWMKETGAPRVPRATRNEIKDRLTNELLVDAPVRTRTFDLVWDLSDNTVLFMGLTSDLEERVKALWLRTFGCSLASIHPVAPADDLASVPYFYLHTWQSVAADALLAGTDTPRLVGKIKFADADGAVIVEAEDVAGSVEARTAVRLGKLPTGLKLHFTMADTLQTLDLTLGTNEVVFTAFKIHTSADDRPDRDAAILDRYSTARRTLALVVQWGKAFRDLYTDPVRWDGWQNGSLAEWVNADQHATE